MFVSKKMPDIVVRQQSSIVLIVLVNNVVKVTHSLVSAGTISTIKLRSITALFGIFSETQMTESQKPWHPIKTRPKTAADILIT